MYKLNTKILKLPKTVKISKKSIFKLSKKKISINNSSSRPSRKITHSSSLNFANLTNFKNKFNTKLINNKNAVQNLKKLNMNNKNVVQNLKKLNINGKNLQKNMKFSRSVQNEVKMIKKSIKSGKFTKEIGQLEKNIKELENYNVFNGLKILSNNNIKGKGLNLMHKVAFSSGWRQKNDLQKQKDKSVQQQQSNQELNQQSGNQGWNQQSGNQGWNQQQNQGWNQEQQPTQWNQQSGNQGWNQQQGFQQQPTPEKTGFWQQSTKGYNEGSVGEDTAMEAVESDVGLQRFMKKIATTMLRLGAVTTAGAIAGIALLLPTIGVMPTLITGIVGSLGFWLWLMFSKPQYQQTLINGKMVNELVPDNKRDMIATGFAAFEGISLAPLLVMAAVKFPFAIPMAFVGALTIMGGFAVYALKQPRGSLLKWGPAIFGCAIGLVVLAVVSLFFTIPVLHTIFPWLAIPLFAVMTAYDLHTAIEGYRQGQSDYLMHGAKFFLNFIVIFRNLLLLFTRD